MKRDEVKHDKEPEGEHCERNADNASGEVIVRKLGNSLRKIFLCVCVRL